MLDSRCTPCYPGERHSWKRLPKRERPTIAICRNCGLTLVKGEEEWMKEEEEKVPDVTAFLKGLRVDGSTNERGWAVIFGSDGDNVAHVRGAPNDDVSAEQAALALVTAAQEWARWAGVIEKARRVYQVRQEYIVNAQREETSERDELMEAYAEYEGARADLVNAALKTAAAIDAALKEGSDE